ncbi:hypothetical protein BGZ60DRAFT_419455 [Tricladium varicosporioides]|nr:hypothetical protein BGZ60DRAFT_419455 [Hymenoscyphus varicosporioides]
MMRVHLGEYLLNLLLLGSSTSAHIQCFYPDGSEANDSVYVPCTGETYSSCCIPLQGDVCQSNGLCYWPSGSYLFRGACTDQTWTSSNCPKVCVNEAKNGRIRATPCGGGGNFVCADAICPGEGFVTYLVQRTPTTIASDGTTSPSTLSSPISQVTNFYSVHSTVSPSNPSVNPNLDVNHTSCRMADGTITSPSCSHQISPSFKGVGRGPTIILTILGLIFLLGGAFQVWFLWSRKNRKSVKIQPKILLPHPAVDNSTTKPPTSPAPSPRHFPRESHGISRIPEFGGLIR